LDIHSSIPISVLQSCVFPHPLTAQGILDTVADFFGLLRYYGACGKATFAVQTAVLMLPSIASDLFWLDSAFFGILFGVFAEHNFIPMGFRIYSQLYSKAQKNRRIAKIYFPSVC